MLTAARVQLALDDLDLQEREPGCYCKDPEEHREWHNRFGADNSHHSATICSKCLADQINGPIAQIIDDVNIMIRSRENG